MVKLIAPDDEDYFVLKPKHSGFYSTTLETLLAYLKAKTLILTGIAGNSCVLFTASDAFMRDYYLYRALGLHRLHRPRGQRLRPQADARGARRRHDAVDRARPGSAPCPGPARLTRPIPSLDSRGTSVASVPGRHGGFMMRCDVAPRRPPSAARRGSSAHARGRRAWRASLCAGRGTVRGSVCAGPAGQLRYSVSPRSPSVSARSWARRWSASTSIRRAVRRSSAPRRAWPPYQPTTNRVYVRGWLGVVHPCGWPGLPLARHRRLCRSPTPTESAYLAVTAAFRDRLRGFLTTLLDIHEAAATGRLDDVASADLSALAWTSLLLVRLSPVRGLRCAWIGTTRP